MSDEEREDELDDLFGDQTRDARDALRRKIRREGAQAAYESLLAVCRDPKAPSPAKATAGVALLRAAGLLGKKAEEDADETEEKPMTMPQMERYLRLLGQRRRALERTLAQDGGEGQPGPGDEAGSGGAFD